MDNKDELQASASLIREHYLKGKPIGTGNVAIAEVHAIGRAFSVGATSRGAKKSPIPDIPIPKSQGGQFEPEVDPHSQRLMDTDAEYKVLSEIASTLENLGNLQIKADLYLYTELKPCKSCDSVVKQFKVKFPFIKVTIFWDHPYP